MLNNFLVNYERLNTELVHRVGSKKIPDSITILESKNKFNLLPYIVCVLHNVLLVLYVAVWYVRSRQESQKNPLMITSEF